MGLIRFPRFRHISILPSTIKANGTRNKDYFVAQIQTLYGRCLRLGQHVAAVDPSLAMKPPAPSYPRLEPSSTGDYELLLSHLDSIR